MPLFKVTIAKVTPTKEIDIGTFDVKDEFEAESDANFELGLHDQRYLNVDNLDVEFAVQKLKGAV